MFIDRPHWKMPQFKETILIKVGMHVRSAHLAEAKLGIDMRPRLDGPGWRPRFYRVERLDFQKSQVELLPLFDPMELTLVHEPSVNVSFEDIERLYRPTLVGDGIEARKPLTHWERIQSGKLFRDP
jgi:hypothetical protein